MAARQGKPEEELFFQRPSSNGEDSPTVEPLRIHKPQSPKPPKESRNKPPSNNLSFPLPPGASSSANPLPYPEYEDTPPPRPIEAKQYRTYHPDDPRPSSGRRGSAAGQQKPAASRKDSYDTAPKLNTSPLDKRGPGLAERRGTAPKPLPESPGPGKHSFPLKKIEFPSKHFWNWDIFTSRSLAKTSRQLQTVFILAV